MFDFDVQPQSAPDLLAVLGLDGRTMRTSLEEPAPFDPRGDDRKSEGSEGRVNGKGPGSQSHKR